MFINPRSLSVILIPEHFPLAQDHTAPLHIACQDGHVDIVETLVKNGADLNLLYSEVIQCIHC